MTRITPSHRALRLCIALALASAVLGLLLVTIPREMVAPQPPLYQFEGLAWRVVQGTTLATSLLAMLIAAILPQAAPAPDAGHGARIGAHLATLLVALIAVANIWITSTTAWELAALDAYVIQVAVLSLGALIGIAGPLALIAALALRLPRRGLRVAALATLALLVLADLALSAGLSPLPTGGPLLALLLLLALALNRRALLPGATRPWLIALAALWALPWMVARLPLAAAALMISDTSQRFPALADALFSPEPANHLLGPLPLLLCLGALASLLFVQPHRRANIACATLLGLAALLPALADATGYAPFSPAMAFDMLRTGALGLGAALATSLGWLGASLAVPLTALVAAWLWLRGTRQPL
ncbi:hypothetical protein [Oceanicola sp. 502str15]|uniref:hypothetical protein n=1 Tax=Oceanicola sp. 502str15 TaxID=2696061 RepID=UPI0020960EC7|nr:hypothetical protein [Oceanicola sp. 502str15]MCO6382368.1 hypothetical protein [Oceanicola sp. 502str15]